jgi:2-isopropylmalate synthase
VQGTQWVKERAEKFPGKIVFEYSPESFTGTELDFALEICTAVQDVWQPTPENPMIFNLPSTVEMTTPNVYADQIEWMSRHFKDRDSIILSVHPHNDRGCGVAATELALLAGAQRVEGTLLGNGERTGNVDILTVAYNMFSQGIDPELNLEDINEIVEVCERCTKMSVDERHPYAGKLVFTAFSGSHQDAINKGITAMKNRKSKIWEVPYLPIDPSDIGRVYEPVVRINSQSGKGGVAFVMSTYYGFKLPKGMHREFADVIQAMSEKQGEVPPEQIMDAFRSEYLYKNEPLHFRKLQVTDMSSDSKTDFDTKVRVVLTDHGEMDQCEAVGNGPLDAVQRGLQIKYGMNIRILDYEEHALKSGSDSQAAAYIHLMDGDSGKITYGVGVSSNITRASVRAVFSAVNRLRLGEKRQGVSDSF